MKKDKKRPGFFRTLVIWVLVLAVLTGVLVAGTNLYVGATTQGSIFSLEDAGDLRAD